MAKSSFGRALDGIKRQASHGSEKQSAAGPAEVEVSQDIVKLGEDLFLVASHKLAVALEKVGSEGARFANKWEVSQALKSLMTADPQYFEVEASNRGATATAGFEAAEPAEALRAALHGSKITVGGHRAVARATLTPARGDTALAAGGDWAEVFGASEDPVDFSAKPAGKRADTVVLRGVPAKWVYANGVGPASQRLLQILRQVGPVHRAEITRADAGSNVGAGASSGINGGGGGGGGDAAMRSGGAASAKGVKGSRKPARLNSDVNDLLASMSPPGGGAGCAGSGPESLLNVDVWVQFSSPHGFRRALQAFAGRVLRKDGAQMVCPLTVEVDLSGYLSDAAVSRRNAAKHRETEAALQQQRQLAAAQKQLVSLRDAFTKVRADVAAAPNAGAAVKAKADAEDGIGPVAPEDAEAVMTAAARATAAVERAAQQVETLATVVGDRAADSERAAMLVPPAREMVAAAASAVAAHAAEAVRAQEKRLTRLQINNDAARRADAAKERDKQMAALDDALCALQRDTTGAAAKATAPELRAAKTALRTLSQLCDTPGSATKLADNLAIETGQLAVSSLAARVYLMTTNIEYRRKLVTLAATASAADATSAATTAAADAAAVASGGESGRRGGAEDVPDMLTAAVLSDLWPSGEGYGPPSTEKLLAAPLPQASDGIIMLCLDRARHHLAVLEQTLAAFDTLRRAERGLKGAEATSAALGDAEEDSPKAAAAVAVKNEGVLEEARRAAEKAWSAAAKVRALVAAGLRSTALAADEAEKKKQAVCEAAADAFVDAAVEASKAAATARAEVAQRSKEAEDVLDRRRIAAKAAVLTEHIQTVRTTEELERREARLGQQVRLKRAQEQLVSYCKDRGLSRRDRRLRQQRGPEGTGGRRDNLAVGAAERWHIGDGGDEWILELQGGKFTPRGRPPWLPKAEDEPWLLFHLQSKVIAAGTAVQASSSASDASLAAAAASTAREDGGGGAAAAREESGGGAAGAAMSSGGKRRRDIIPGNGAGEGGRDEVQSAGRGRGFEAETALRAKALQRLKKNRVASSDA